MLSYIWPIVLLVFSNTLYQISAKSMPDNIDAFAALTVSYIVGAMACAALYFAFGGRNILREISKINLVPIAIELRL